jgi:hypothetical protein
VVRLRRGILVAACGLLLAVDTAGCSDGDEPLAAPIAVPVAPSVSPATPLVSCDHVIGWEPPPPTFEVILEAVALPTRAVLQAHETNEPGWLFAKQGLVVRADTVVDLVVPAEVAGHLRIGWGSPGPEGTSIRVPGCASGGQWVAFAGGYTVDAPACVPLIVRSGGREARVRIAVGARCRAAP